MTTVTLRPSTDSSTISSKHESTSTFESISTFSSTPIQTSYYDESAFQWNRRIKRNRKRLIQNPMDDFFPPLFSSNPINIDIATKKIDEKRKKVNESCGNFVITSAMQENLIALSAETFTCRPLRLNNLQSRLIQWRRRRRQEKKKTRSSLETIKDPCSETNDAINTIDGDTGSSSTAGKPAQLSKLEQTFLNSFPKGTGLRFIDQTLFQSPYPFSSLSSKHLKNENVSERNFNGVVMEITGRSGTAKTRVLISLAANYVAATSSSFFYSGCDALIQTKGFADLEGNRGVESNSWGDYGGRDMPQTSDTDNDDDDSSSNYCDEVKTKMVRTMEPPVIIFDPEYSINTAHLASAVRTAMLRRWNATDAWRRCLEEELEQKELLVRGREIDEDKSYKKHRLNDHQSVNDSTNLEEKNVVTMENKDLRYDKKRIELSQIEKEVVNALGRINIIRPRDIANGYVASLESLRQSLDRQNKIQEENLETEATISRDEINVENEDPFSNNYADGNHDKTRKTRHRAPNPPAMVLFDSILSAFDPIDRMFEALPWATTTTTTGTNTIKGNSHDAMVWEGRSGLSGRNEFLRQLNRLRSRHNLFVVATRTTRAGSTSNGANVGSNLPGWNKMVTHRLALEHVARGTKEEMDGFDFVALVPEKKMSTTAGGASSADTTLPKMSGNHHCRWTKVVPFLVTPDGICC